MRNIEVCYSPELFPLFDAKGKIVVVTDILRATSVICTMFKNGVEKVIPVRNIDEARALKEEGYMVVAERNGQKLDFADFGNSPLYFSQEVVAGKTLVYSTTNGTNALTIAKEAKHIVVGAFLNFNAITDFIENNPEDILILCAGWKGKYNIEDTLFAGAVCEKLLEKDGFETICDSTHSAIDLWSVAKKDLTTYIDKAAQRHRLKKMGLDDVIEYCLTFNITSVLPTLSDRYLVDLNAEKIKS